MVEDSMVVCIINPSTLEAPAEASESLSLGLVWFT